MKTEKNISQEQLEKVERFLNNSMETNERVDFEKRMEQDSDFKLLVEDIKQMLFGIESAALKNKLDDFHDDIIPVRNLSLEENSSKRSLSSRIFTLSIAASVILALGIFLFMDQDSSSEKLFAKHFTPDPGLPTNMSTSNDFNFYDAMVDYKRAEYTSAIRKWELLHVQKQNNDTLNFYLGVSYLAEGNTVKASQYLEEAVKTSNSIFIADAYYYAALAEIKKENTKKARELLIKSNSEKSKILLKDLTN